jgi:hypothetical protein
MNTCDKCRDVHGDGQVYLCLEHKSAEDVCLAVSEYVNNPEIPMDDFSIVFEAWRKWCGYVGDLEKGDQG